MGDESPAVVSTWVHTRYTVRKILVMLVMLIVRCVSLRSLVWPRRQLRVGSVLLVVLST